MATAYEVIAKQAVQIALELPASLIQTLAQAIATSDVVDWGYARQRLLELTPQPRLRALVERFLDTWHRRAAELSPQSVALALVTATATAQHCREAQVVELIWTGPGVMEVPLRRTDQALLEVINAAHQSLLVVSFAVYKIPAITAALVGAFERGVDLRICVEAPEPSGERIAYDTIKALGPAVQQRAAIYIWPQDQRPADEQGHTGRLHAKCAVADEQVLFISSANLTDYAMNLNMEMGTLIRGGPLPQLVAAHFARLIEGGVLRQVQGSHTNR